MRAGLGRLLENDLDAVLRLTGIQVERRDYPDWLVNLQTRGVELRLDGGPQAAIHARLSGNGQFSLGLGAPLPLQGELRGQLVRDRIEAQFDVAALDMRVLNTVLAPTTPMTVPPSTFAVIAESSIFGA
jgi:hypothetical protein